MKRIAVILIVVMSLAVGRPAGEAGLPGGDDFRELVFAAKVSDNIALLFGQFETELVLCLEGEWRGSDLYITDFRMPHILSSKSGRVQAAACKSGRRSVGTWHNHPAPGHRLTSASVQVLARNCYLSRTDISDFQRRSDAFVTVVSCAPNMFAYWKRSDVDSLSDDVALLPPPEGQLVYSEMLDGGPADLTQARGR
ncbi:MAG: hypothetical protein GWN99_11075 [Gemmatimonadetes bacterium]|uniref:JAB domain-containing protein n=1 Tax=Candidatus Kutchimonas denitrificans TaxID=3056748 RepID=A0AAE4ZAA1_9BACT|nr:hypothetical protein [Gemmatimonadota bacterium]NIR75006.1 hypothetical protein [Candidatus Kutchimonas denitrificans]NIS01589.1 hypothetical protein [Gemmatimonadota bacterium]NIT67327.1 hypothetical protein [Gemmatimonadota bacterium]NIU52690.1 hypothetical protein [Gemmatimonadota bacterium]